MKLFFALPFMTLSCLAIAEPAARGIEYAPMISQSGENCRVVLRYLATPSNGASELDTTVVIYPCRALIHAGLIEQNGDALTVPRSARAMRPAEFAAQAERSAGASLPGKPAL